MTFVGIALAVAFYIFARINNKRLISAIHGDSITHLLVHRMVCEGKAYLSQGMFGELRLRLPHAYHKVLAMIFPKPFPSRWVESSNICLQILAALSIAMILLMTGVSMMNAALAALFFITLPLHITTENTELFSYQRIGERYPALILNSTFFLSLILLDVGSAPHIAIGMSVFAVMIGWLSVRLGKFSTQAVFFVGVSYGVVTARWEVLAILGIVWVLAFTSNEGRDQFRDHLTFIRNYKSYQLNNFLVGEEKLSRFIGIRLASRKIVRLYARLILHSGIGIAKHFHLLVLPLAMFWVGEVPEDKYQGALALIFVAAGVCFLTSTHLFFVFGIGYRYLINTLALPTVFMVAPNSTYLAVGIAINCAIYLWEVLVEQNSKKIERSRRQNDELMAIAKMIPDGSRLLGFHYKLVELCALANPLIYVSSTRSYHWDEESLTYFDVYPLLKLSAKNVQRLEATHTVVEKRSSFSGIPADLMFAGDHFDLYEMNDRRK